MSVTSKNGHLVRSIDETSGAFLVSFTDLAAYYHATAPQLQHVIRTVHAEKREVRFSADRFCEIPSAEIRPRRRLSRRLADVVREACEGFVDVMIRRNTRWIRDAQRAARAASATGIDIARAASARNKRR